MFNFFETTNINETEARFLIHVPHISVPTTKTEVYFCGHLLRRYGDNWEIDGEYSLCTPDGQEWFEVSMNKEKETYEIDFFRFHK